MKKKILLLIGFIALLVFLPISLNSSKELHGGTNNIGLVKISRAFAGPPEWEKHGDPTVTTQVLSQNLTAQPNAKWVLNFYNICRSFLNIFLVAILIFIAFANILHYNISTYAIKTMLPKIIGVAIAANVALPLFAVFSRLVDSLGGLTLFYPRIFVWPSPAYFSPIVIIIFAILVAVLVAIFFPDSKCFAIVWGCAAVFTPFLGTTIVHLILGFRPYLIFLAAAVSPIAIALSILPQTAAAFKKWVGIVVVWMLLPLIMYGLINLVDLLPGSTGNIGGDGAISSLIGLLLPLILRNGVILLAMRAPFMLEKDVSKVVDMVGKYAYKQGRALPAVVGGWEENQRLKDWKSDEDRSDKWKWIPTVGQRMGMVANRFGAILKVSRPDAPEDPAYRVPGKLYVGDGYGDGPRARLRTKIEQVLNILSPASLALKNPAYSVEREVREKAIESTAAEKGGGQQTSPTAAYSGHYASQLKDPSNLPTQEELLESVDGPGGAIKKVMTTIGAGYMTPQERKRLLKAMKIKDIGEDRDVATKILEKFATSSVPKKGPWWGIMELAAIQSGMDIEGMVDADLKMKDLLGNRNTQKKTFATRKDEILNTTGRRGTAPSGSPASSAGTEIDQGSGEDDDIDETVREDIDSAEKAVEDKDGETTRVIIDGQEPIVSSIEKLTETFTSKFGQATDLLRSAGIGEEEINKIVTAIKSSEDIDQAINVLPPQVGESVKIGLRKAFRDGTIARSLAFAKASKSSDANDIQLIANHLYDRLKTQPNSIDSQKISEASIVINSYENGAGTSSERVNAAKAELSKALNISANLVTGRIATRTVQALEALTVAERSQNRRRNI